MRYTYGQVAKGVLANKIGKPNTPIRTFFSIILCIFRQRARIQSTVATGAY